MIGNRSKTLFDLASRFRAALEKCDKNRLSDCFADFPSGSCGDASLLLSVYFAENGISDVFYVSGELSANGERETHAWLECGDYIIDITADQYPEIQSPVIVTSDHTWYHRFAKIDRDAGGLETYDGYTRAMLKRDYAQVVKCFPQ